MTRVISNYSNENFDVYSLKNEKNGQKMGFFNLKYLESEHQPSQTMYEVCPESIGHTFISPRHSVRATSAGHERQQ